MHESEHVLSTGEEPSFSVALDRLLRQASRVDLEHASALLAAVLYRAMDAMAPSIATLSAVATPDGFVTPEDVRVRSASAEEASGCAVVLERDGVTILICVGMHLRGGTSDFDATSATSAGAGRGSLPEPRVAWLGLNLLFKTDEGPAARPLYEIGSWHETCLEDGSYQHESSQEASVVDVGLGFLPFELLSSAFGASAMLDAVRDRSLRIGLSDRMSRTQDETAPLLTELVRAIAPLDEGIPGPMMMRRLMQVYAGAAAIRLQSAMAMLPSVIQALVASGHVSMREGFDVDGLVLAHVVPSNRGATLHLEAQGDWFEVTIVFDDRGAMLRVTLARSNHPASRQMPTASAFPIFHREISMGTYALRGDMLIPDGPLADDFDLFRQVQYFHCLLADVSTRLWHRHSEHRAQ